MKRIYSTNKYYLDLTKEASVFIMMAYGFFNEAMITRFGPMIGLIAIAFMFIPRTFIYDALDIKIGTSKRKDPEWMRKMNIALNYVKFVCLVILTLYIFLNNTMTENFGPSLLWMASCFMVIPRKLINLVSYDVYRFKQTLIY